MKMVAWKISKSSGVRISVANSRAMPLALYAKGEKEKGKEKERNRHSNKEKQREKGRATCGERHEILSTEYT